MSDTQHTPEPWILVGNSIMVEYRGGFFDLAYVDGIFPNGYLTIAERNANGNLMVASPALLAACEAQMPNSGYSQAEAHEMARAAIAKAKGETS